MSYKLLLIARVKSYLLHTSYEFLFILSYELSFSNELRVTGYSTSYELPFGYELQVTVYFTSYELIFAYEL